jgi:prophage DNA circulation protein
MTPDTVLQLGDFAFAAFEVPESIRFGGSQRMSVKELIGGKRVIDCMGRSDRPLEWSGVFTGPDAAARAQFMDSLRVGGRVQSVSWGQFKYQVVVRDFEADYQRFYRIPYHIVCEVSADQTQPVTVAPLPAVDAAIQDDFNSALGLGGLIGDGNLSTLLGGLDTAISAVSSFANAAQSQINSVLLPLGAIQGRVSTLIGASTTTLQNVTTFGGVLPGTPFAQVGAQLNGQTANMLQSNNLFLMRNVCGRMSANLVSINQPPQKIAMAGGNLFQVAQSQYGDATAWTALARANGLTDPFVHGTATIAIPKRPGSSGGILNA